MEAAPIPDDAARKPRSYASPAILARRRRVLASTRDVLAACGIDGTSMYEVASRAAVSRRQLYYMFDSRETLIAAAVQDRLDQHLAGVAFRTPPGSIERVIERIEATVDGAVDLRLCVQVAAELYFRHSQPGATHSEALARRQYADWLARLDAAGELKPWSSAAELTKSLVRYEFAMINDWSNGRLPGTRPSAIIVEGLLSFIMGFVDGSAHGHIRQLRDRFG